MRPSRDPVGNAVAVDPAATRSSLVRRLGDWGERLRHGVRRALGAGKTGVDAFRIKVWDRASGVVVYDNRRGGSDDMDAADPQAIGGGSIVVQRAK